MSTHRRHLLLLTTLAGFARHVGAQDLPAPLRFGVVPYLTARRLATLYEPARVFFERELSRPLQFSSAPDFAVHLERLRKHEYDLVADSLPIARLAQRELGYLPIARTRATLEPILVVAVDSPLRTLEGLRGRAVAVSDRLATLTLIGLRFLRDHGLQPGKDVAVRIAGNHANAVQRMLAGEAAAAIVTRTSLKQMEPALAARVRVVIDLPKALSPVVFSVAPTLAAKAPALGRRLIEFAAVDPAGKAFIESLAFLGLLAVGNELEQVDPLVVEFYRQLGLAD